MEQNIKIASAVIELQVDTKKADKQIASFQSKLSKNDLKIQIATQREVLKVDRERLKIAEKIASLSTKAAIGGVGVVGKGLMSYLQTTDSGARKLNGSLLRLKNTTFQVLANIGKQADIKFNISGNIEKLTNWLNTLTKADINKFLDIAKMTMWVAGFAKLAHYAFLIKEYLGKVSLDKLLKQQAQMSIQEMAGKGGGSAVGSALGAGVGAGLAGKNLGNKISKSIEEPLKQLKISNAAALRLSEVKKLNEEMRKGKKSGPIGKVIKDFREIEAFKANPIKTPYITSPFKGGVGLEGMALNRVGKGLRSGLGAAGKGVESLGGSTLGSAGIISAGVVAIAGLVGLFKSEGSGIKRFKSAMEETMIVLKDFGDVLIIGLLSPLMLIMDTIKNFGLELSNIFTGNFSGFISKEIDAFKNAGATIQEALYRIEDRNSPESIAAKKALEEARGARAGTIGGLDQFQVAGGSTSGGFADLNKMFQQMFEQNVQQGLINANIDNTTATKQNTEAINGLSTSLKYISMNQAGKDGSTAAGGMFQMQMQALSTGSESVFGSNGFGGYQAGRNAPPDQINYGF